MNNAALVNSLLLFALSGLAYSENSPRTQVVVSFVSSENLECLSGFTHSLLLSVFFLSQSLSLELRSWTRPLSVKILARTV